MRYLNVSCVVRQLVYSAACALAAGAAVGAESAAEPEIEQVVVTGSRLATTGFTTPTPVTVLGAEAIQELGITNIGAGANQLPAFRATTTPTTNGFGSFNVGAQIVNLRGLGVTRNLVLVDGRRFAPVTREGTVDLNLIPSGLVERLEVVTGGASAAYGSDAVAGAVNVILNKNLQGIKAQADVGVTNEGDGFNSHFSLAGGSSFAGGRGHFIIGGEYAKQEGIGDCFTRSYCTNSAVITNTGAGAIPSLGVTLYRVGSGAGFIGNTRGVINVLNNTATGPTAVVSTTVTNSIRNLAGTGAITFDAAGNVMPYRLGAPSSGSTGIGPDTTSSYTTTQLEVPVDRYATFGHAYFDFTDNVQGFIEGSYGHVNGEVDQSRYFGTALPIFADDPFIPAAVRALLPAASATPSATRPATPNFNLTFIGQRRGHSASDVDSMRATTGLKVKLNDKWDWDAYYQYAHTDRFQSVENNLVTGAPRLVAQGPGAAGISNAASTAYWSWANDAVYDPADAALPVAQRHIVCRATLSTDAALRAAAAGCVPFNPFGSQASQAALDYVYRTLTEDIHIAQHVVAANIKGEVFDLWAGPLSIATGLEYRHDSTSLQHDALSNSYAYFQNFGADYNARQDVTEGYLEAELPLAHDLPLIHALNFNGAVRRTRYDISGFGSPRRAQADNKLDATTWKLGLVWEPLDWARFRFTTSRDIRAPNFNELFQASASTFGSVSNLFAGGAGQFPVLLSGGNPDLKPEEGRTTTIGLVLQPQFIEGLSVSLDYYRIKVNGYIGTPGGAQNIVNRCYNLNDQDLCPLITFGPGQSLTEVRNVNVNLQWLRTSGLDIETAYRLPLSRFSGLPGTMNFRLLASRTYELATNLYGAVTDRAGETGGTGGSPTWLATLNSGYSNGPFTGTLTTRYIRGGILSAAAYEPGQPIPVVGANTTNDNHIGGTVYFNLNSSWKMGDKFGTEVFVQVNNLANRAPPSAPQLQFPSNPVYFDLIGRSYRLGVRMKL